MGSGRECVDGLIAKPNKSGLCNVRGFFAIQAVRPCHFLVTDFANTKN